MKAMIFAAGLGTRLRPLTTSIPKALVEINGVPLLHIALRKLIRSGFHEIIINIHHKPDMIRGSIDAFQAEDAIIRISDESETLLETGGGLKKAAWFFDDEPFLLHNVDVISDINLLKLYEDHRKSGSLATLAVSERTTSRYLLFNKGLMLKGWKNTSTGEKKPQGLDDSTLIPYAFSGIHVVSSELIKKITEKGKFSLIDVYLRLCNSYRIRAYVHKAENWIDIGNPESLEKIRSNHNLQKFG
jgi:NDP-sugar pyrophosphorylase family protein